MQTIDQQLSLELCKTNDSFVTANNTNIFRSKKNDTPLTAATENLVIAEPFNPLNNPLRTPPRVTPGDNLTISSVLRSIKGQSTTRGRFINLNEVNRPVSPIRQPVQDNMLMELSRLLSENEMYSVDQIQEAVPLKLFELSLESPNLSGKPSIDLPPTFSKAPSAKKTGKTNVISSQESIFVAATQFPQIVGYGISPQQSQPTVSSNESVVIPATQYRIPVEGQLQTTDLFNGTGEFGKELNITPKLLDHDYSGQEIVTLPLFDYDENENPFHIGEVENDTFLLKKRSNLEGTGGVQKKVQFAKNSQLIPNGGTSSSLKELFDSELGATKSLERRKSRRLSLASVLRPNLGSSRESIRSTPSKCLPSSNHDIFDPLIPSSLPSASKSKLSKSSPVTRSSSIVRKRFLGVEKHNSDENKAEGNRLLTPHMLVWAKWRPQYFAPAILQEKSSRTRNLWKVRFCHWKEQRAKSFSSDDLAPCDLTSLQCGDDILIFRNRSRMIFESGKFRNWTDLGAVVFENSETGTIERIEISKVAINKKLFQIIQNERVILPSQPTSLSPPPYPPSQTLTVKKKGKTKFLSGYSFLISLGGLGSSAKRVQKSLLVTRIKSLGGKVLNEDEHLEPGIKRILLENSFCRTAKTFLALVLNIPLVKIEWLESCEKSSQFLSYKDFLVEIPGRVPSDSLTNLLSGWEIACEGSKKFKCSWIPVCKAAGAVIISGYLKLNPEGKSRILVESLPSASSKLVRHVGKTGIVIITVDWLMNAIINGRCL